jgi:hypothetical protein
MERKVTAYNYTAMPLSFDSNGLIIFLTKKYFYHPFKVMSCGASRAPEDCPKSVVDLVRQCTATDPLVRPTANDLAKDLRRIMAEVN